MGGGEWAGLGFVQELASKPGRGPVDEPVGGLVPAYGGGAWTGWLEFGLVDEWMLPVARVEFKVQIDIVTVWLGSRTLAVFSRHRLGSWLERPVVPLAEGDVWLSVTGRGRLLMQVDGYRVVRVPSVVLGQLRERI